MSCNHCSIKFNFFHKEMGCANCGLSFCNKCLKQKCKIPDKGNSEQHVCRLCYNKLTSPSVSTTSSNVIIPPDVFIKRLESLENPAAPPITVYKQDKKIQALRSGLSEADQKLVDRLEKLKESKGVPPSDSEIRQRLAVLKGENEYVEGPSSKAQLLTKETPQTADSLLEQFINEEDIELSHNPQEGIEARLATLREQGVRPNEGPYISNLHDSGSSEEEINKITRKIMDEVALEDRCAESTRKLEGKSETNDEDELRKSSPELPWCVLCNNDAKFRCYDCGGDLYCNECNIEAHKNWGDTDHKVVPYKPPS